MLYLFLLLNLACGLAILHFGLRHYSVTLAGAVFFFILETGVILAELGIISGLKWPLIVGLVAGVLTFLLAKPLTYLWGWGVSWWAFVLPFVVLGLQPGTTFANIVVLLGLVFATVMVIKYRSHFRTLVIGCYGGYITGSFLSLIYLLFIYSEATQFTLDNPNSLLPVMLGPIVCAIAATVILFTKPAFTKDLVLYPLESGGTEASNAPGDQPAA